ncbi:alpha/beta fold hydrolase [Roseomonas sp. CCTCC AB2023176]|uniref:alpha/beta fold hydrolase n=1 Tax=Roseomonas sp. CCTCC AB2023176 TaxID=3342640 RepID=UPI0035E15E46
MSFRRVLRLALLLILVGLGATACGLYAPDAPRPELEARYAAPPSQFIPVDGVRLHVRDTGPRDAPPVILLHGFASSLHTWEDWAGMLAADHRVIRLDLPGFGLTGADPSGDYSDARTVEVITALMDRLGVARADVVGSSMGGRIAWTMAATRPERVDRLVLMAPDGFAGPGRTYGTPQRVPFLLRLLPYTLPTPLLRASLEPAYADKAVLTEATLDRYRAMLLAPGVRQAILDRSATAVLQEPEPILRRIRAPVLLLWGQEDRMIPASHAADYQRALPEARLVVLPGLGHVPMEEDPARSLAPVRDFLAR